LIAGEGIEERRYVGSVMAEEKAFGDRIQTAMKLPSGLRGDRNAASGR